jgi:hypothetical protein
MNAIIFIPSLSRYAPACIYSKFLWSDEHKAHIWEGRELSHQEFNEVADKVLLEEGYFIRPSVRLIAEKTEPPSEAMLRVVETPADSTPQENVESITPAKVNEFLEAKKKYKNKK